MPSLTRKLPAIPRTAMLCIGSFLLSALPLSASAAAQQTQPVIPSEVPQPEYLVPVQLAPSEISTPDAAIIRARHREIEDEATFFGYDLSAGHWTYEQSVCPEIPDLLLHFHSTARNGSQSLFTVLVPRGKGRVQVVPVLYRGATPFHSALDSPRTMAVFNRVVPAQIAQKAADPDGPWLNLALCYAEVAGAEPRVPQRASDDPGLVKAPLPTLHLSEASSTREILFTDRNAPGGYLVWNIVLDKNGRVTAASTRSLADYVGHAPAGKEPKERILPEGAEPRAKPLPPGKQPPAVPKPQ